MTPETLRNVWDDLASSTPGPGGFDRRRLDTTCEVDLFACIFWPEGRLGLLIEGEGEYRFHEDRIPQCRGVEVAHNVASHGATVRTVLYIKLEDPQLVDIFSMLSADLVTAILAEFDAPSSFMRCLDRLARWQAFFEHVPPGGLSATDQRGLIGELLILEQMFLATLPPLSAVRTWRGQGRAHQDFKNGGLAVEVKTTLAKRHTRIQIANEKQLDERPHAELLLAHVRLDESGPDGLTLPALVLRLRASLEADHVALHQFNDRLLEGGYLDLHAPLYSDAHYRLSGVRFFRVAGDFPRLTEANLPLGVGDITYSIVADDLARHEVSRDLAASMIDTTDDRD